MSKVIRIRQETYDRLAKRVSGTFRKTPDILIQELLDKLERLERMSSIKRRRIKSIKNE